MKIRLLKVILTILILNLATNCGFTPIYKNSSLENGINYEEKLAAIKFQTKRKRINQKLRINLEKNLNPKKIITDKKYLLEIDLEKSIHGTIINRTGSSGRNKVILTANYQLTRISDGEIISKGFTRANDDFDVEDKRFANYTLQEQIELNLTDLIAQNIRNSLINDLLNESKEE